MKAIISITPNSGGVLQPKNIVGRDEIIEEFWGILKQKGINLFAESGSHLALTSHKCQV